MKFKGFFTLLALALICGDIPIVHANEERDVLSINTTTELIQVLKELRMEVRCIKEFLEKCDMCKATTPACPEVTTDASTATNTSPPPDMATTTFGPPDKINYRLPRHISPILYTLRLLPIIEGEFIEVYPSVDYYVSVRDKGNFSIFGEIEIDMVCSENTKNIVLHINDIDVHEETIQVSGEGLEGILVHHTYFDKITQFFTIYLSDELKAGMQLSLTMSYLAKLNRLGGFYRSSYFDEPYNISSVYYDNMDIQSLRHIAATQFQPTDARRAFPCFDEPNFKARFAITLGRKKNMTSLSNMPVNRTVPHQSMPDYEWDIYEESAPMSTYIVFFVISDFVKNTAPNTGETEVTVWSRPGTEEQTRYAISIASKVLEYFEEFFQIPYPLQKHDMIAIPDVGPRATDNYGSIIYSERAVLYHPDFSSAINKQQVAVAIAYKLARQWIDNSQITSDWWDFLWLNEGLAIYLEFKGVGWVEPDMKMEQQYLNDVIHHAMQLDESGFLYPYIMEVEINEIDDIEYEINRAFDLNFFKKGASILRMMEDFLGLQVFKEGLTDYLNYGRYYTATTDNLWKFLDIAATKYSVDLNGLTVKDIMDTWFLFSSRFSRSTFPVVKVYRNPENYSEITVKQEEPNEYDPREIPLTFIQDFTNNSSLKRRWLSNTRSNTPVVYTDVVDKPDSWIICNHKVFGYYRVDYDDINWDLILNQLQTNHTQIHVMNRAQLIDDAFTLAGKYYSGVSLNHTYKRALDLTTYLKKELDWLPWETAYRNFEKLQNLLSGTEAGALLNSHIQSLVLHLYDLYSFTEDPLDKHLDLQLKSITVRIACETNFAPCVKEVKKIFDWKKDSSQGKYAIHESSVDYGKRFSRITPNLKSAIICTEMKHFGTALHFHFLIGRYLSTNVATERGHILSGLTCTNDIILLRGLLDVSISDDIRIRKEDALYIYHGMARNEIGRSLALSFIRDHFEQIASRYGGNHTTVQWIQAVSMYNNKESDAFELYFIEKENPQLKGEYKHEIFRAFE